MMKGRFAVNVLRSALIGNMNKISNATVAHYHDVSLTLAEGASVINGNVFDMTDCIYIGENTTLAGTATQIWTHSYFITKGGSKRLDSPVRIGKNCYIGARCCIMPGVTINDGVIVGAQTCVNKNLDKVGLYVSSSLRFIEYDVEEKIKSLGEPVCENRIYRKD